jgi:hypothetical protein
VAQALLPARSPRTAGRPDGRRHVAPLPLAFRLTGGAAPHTALLVLLLALALACREPAPPKPPPPPAVAATVLVYETVVAHEHRSFRWQVVTDGVRVRFGDEAERWRLIDTKARTIAFVDQSRRTNRIVSYDLALAARETLLAAPLPQGAPLAKVSEEPAGLVDGRDALRVSVEAGGYKRTMLFSTAPILPATASAMKWATDPIDTEYAGVIRDLMPAIVSKQGTLLADRNEITYAGGVMAVETHLVSVTTSRLPKSLFELPVGFSAAEPN